HPWLLFGADKMSKSKGNIIYADDLVRHFGVDGVRYYVLEEMPFAADGSITYESIIDRYNANLANNLGNLVNRTLAMTGKYFESVVPSGDFREALDDELVAAFEEAKKNYCELMDNFKLADAIEEVFGLLRRANKYIDETTPWILAKDEAKKARLGTVLYNLLETIRISAVMLSPIMPSTAKAIFEVLPTDKCDFASIDSFGALECGTTIGASAHLFDRIDEVKKMEEINAEIAERAKANAPEEVIEKPEGVAQIGFDDFMKVELRVAKVLECESVPKAKKLLKLQLDLGYEKRQVFSGIAKFYKPEDLIGKKVILVTNLAPATLCGVESNGMILASGEEEIKVVFLEDSAKLGDRIR
ncbi:MAG: methionine--tRNA ligase subunit beta, partial [Clostridia bacterium]|nr:methionine--tRNA ligase subunit beta [Clostridia bacterium]